ncbi:hypothetical protein EJB05_51074 [Eragrostis curvula]|uniref:SGNH hydrolase-type esterase domain-containing protein n=1 Tax=Eragrostis curvula TaxID=38414 RepID=A0A5J9SWI2_9POAL|nr:hypothetical protein EJB05_51074 [Eragrostis curvula]
MKISASLFFCFLVVVLNGALVESRKSGNNFRYYYQLFVFGDSFADTGNLPKSDLSEVSRQWYTPYGTTRGVQTGRFSDGNVQTDFVATILGRYRIAPTTYRVAKRFGDPAGMNFAHGGAGVFEVPRKVPTLSQQIGYFKELIDSGIIDKWNIDQSVAMIAISGNDYIRVANMTSEKEMIAFVGKVTSEIAKCVKRLQKIGLGKVLVNNMHPLGCTPWQTRPANYTQCKTMPNMGTFYHNDGLNKKLNAAKSDDVYVVDLYKAFSSIVNPSDSTANPPLVARQFTHKLKPCCRSSDPDGYCGQVDDDGKELFTLCDNPENHFYWDDVHPSDAGWDAVMEQLERDMKDFLYP